MVHPLLQEHPGGGRHHPDRGDLAVGLAAYPGLRPGSLFDAGAVPGVRHRYLPWGAEDQRHRHGLGGGDEPVGSRAHGVPSAVHSRLGRLAVGCGRLHYLAADRYRRDPRAGHRRICGRGGDHPDQPDPAAGDDFLYRHQQEGGQDQP
ncbi:hypothetical protein D3C80_1351050 [compost metagenome]